MVGIVAKQHHHEPAPDLIGRAMRLMFLCLTLLCLVLFRLPRAGSVRRPEGVYRPMRTEPGPRMACAPLL